MSTDLREFYASALRATFGQLFDQEQLALIHYSEQRGGDLCLIVYGSPDLRIKFEIELGIPSCFLGNAQAAPIWGGELNGEEVWFAEGSLLDFLEGKDHDTLIETGPQQPPSAALQSMLREPAQRLQAQIKGVREVFAQPSTSPFWTRYHAHRAERIQQIRRRFGV
jgi:hypothetical protein